MIDPAELGSAQFRRDYGLRYAYLAGSMFKGIASTDLVTRMARAGLMGFFGAGGLAPDRVDEALRTLRAAVPDGRFGMNLLATPGDPNRERVIVELYLRHGVRYVEAAAYTQVTPNLVRLRLAGPRQRILAKVSRPEVATAFLSPPPPAMVDQLVAAGRVSQAQAAAGRNRPVATEICVEADSAGHTDAGNLYALLPGMIRLREEQAARHGYRELVPIGAAGGLGSPEAVAAAFVLGADFVLTGSVNQCTPEAGTSDRVKDLLATLDVQDTGYAPAGDMFESGARVQVVRRATLFAARANRLYQLYREHTGLDDLDAGTREQIEQRFFRRPLAQVWEETRQYLNEHRAPELDRAERDPKVKMAQIFKWYFVHSTRVALLGDPTESANYQIHCGPAMGSFNRTVAGTPMQDWRRRHCDDIAQLLMIRAAEHLWRVTCR